MPKYAPDSREADSWFSDEQLEKVTPADAVDDPLYSPIPTQMVSNGEYMPEPQTQQQKHVEVRLKELADHASKKLGISRRDFMTTSGGMAASFIAMNDAFGKFFKVDKEEMFEPEAYATTSCTSSAPARAAPAAACAIGPAAARSSPCKACPTSWATSTRAGTRRWP